MEDIRCFFTYRGGSYSTCMEYTKVNNGSLTRIGPAYRAKRSWTSESLRTLKKSEVIWFYHSFYIPVLSLEDCFVLTHLSSTEAMMLDTAKRLSSWQPRAVSWTPHGIPSTSDASSTTFCQYWFSIAFMEVAYISSPAQLGTTPSCQLPDQLWGRGLQHPDTMVEWAIFISTWHLLYSQSKDSKS